MSRITISNDGGAILIRQGTTVIVLAPEQAQSVAATIVLESERMADRQHRDDQRRMQAFDSEIRSWYALGGSLHSKRTIASDGNDETETRSDGRQRLREAGLDGTDSTGG